MNEINTIFQKLPPTIKSFVVANSDLSYTIVLNSRLSYEQNRNSYFHEIMHIKNGDYDKQCEADFIEISAHKI